MKRREFLANLGYGTVVIASGLAGPRGILASEREADSKADDGSSPPRPNVLFLFTDDQRYDTIRALGNTAIHTPNIDRLVRRGVSFTNAYIMGGSSPAVCSPSRACLFSGRTLWNLENQGMWGYEISAKYRTLPQVFRESGYVTFGTGKNEPGRAGRPHPRRWDVIQETECRPPRPAVTSTWAISSRTSRSSSFAMPTRRPAPR